MEATLPHLAEVVADMVRFQRFTGCRPAEVCLVRPCDVDTSGDVCIYHSAPHGLVPEAAANHASRASRLTTGIDAVPDDHAIAGMGAS